MLSYIFYIKYEINPLDKNYFLYRYFRNGWNTDEKYANINMYIM